MVMYMADLQLGRVYHTVTSHQLLLLTGLLHCECWLRVHIGVPLPGA